MSKKAHADLSAFVERLSPGATGRGRHSPLFRWLYDRSEAFKRVLEETCPSWDAVTDALVKEGLTNGDGKPLTRRRVQKTWYAVERARVVTRPRLKPADPIQRPTYHQPVESDDLLTVPRTFGTAKLRNNVSSAVSSPPLLADPKPQLDPDRADRVIETLTFGASRNRFKTDNGE